MYHHHISDTLPNIWFERRNYRKFDPWAMARYGIARHFDSRLVALVESGIGLENDMNPITKTRVRRKKLTDQEKWKSSFFSGTN